MTTAPQTKPLPPRPPPRQNPTPPSPAPSAAAPNGDFSVSSGIKEGPQRIGIYGPGAVGKTSLAALLKKHGKNPCMVDIEDGSKNLDINRIESHSLLTWDQIRAALHHPLWDQFDITIVDSLTKAEDRAAADILQKSNVDSLEKADGGYGKGYRSLDERMMLLLADLDSHIRKGRSVVVIMHDCTARVPHPGGPDYIRYEPRLYQSERISIRNRVKEWVDHLFFVNFDVAAVDGKATGGSTRAIYCQPQAHFIAKSRTLSGAFVFEEGSTALWEALFNK